MHAWLLVYSYRYVSYYLKTVRLNKLFYQRLHQGLSILVPQRTMYSV